MSKSITLTVLPDTYAVVRLDAHSPVPAWATQDQLFSVTRTADELSVLCRTVNVPEGQQVQLGFRALKATGPFDFSEVGILSSLLKPLADDGISIFAVSTYDTDYIFVDNSDLDAATAALSLSGHSIQTLKID